MTLSPSTAPAEPERLLRQSALGLNPSAAAKARVLGNLQRKMTAARLLETARAALEPAPEAAPVLWARVRSRLDPVATTGFWDKVRDALRPSPDSASTVWARIAPQLEASPVRAFHPLKWAAAFAVVAIVVRLSPLLVLAPRTVAESPITATTTRGTASILVGGLWQPIGGELRLQKASRLQTDDGELTIVLHDDAVFRLAPHTTVSLNDVGDRPSSPSGEPTLTLEQGSLWVMGFAPKPLRGITIGTAQGWVTVQEGSLSVDQEAQSAAIVRSWDRSATVTRRGIAISILAGEELTLKKDESLTPRKLDTALYADAWVTANIARDAVHQKELAQMQRERRAASAGILPDSRLYPVKRLAEAVDVLLTFGSEAKARKVLNHANTRLSEAAALLTTGTGAEAQTQAQTALKEFRDTVLSVATGSGDTAIDEILEDEVVASATADTSAALPTDDAYLLKQAVRETIASLPDTVEKPDVAAAAVLDEVTLAKRHAEEGDLSVAQAKLAEVRESLSAQTGTSAVLTPEGRQEVEATIAAVENTVEEQDDRPDKLPDSSAALTRRTDPLLPSEPSRPPLTDEEVEQYVQRIRGQIFVFELRRSQMNELREQIHSLDHSPDKGRILRRLYHVMPNNGLAQEIRRQIGILDEQNRAIQRRMQESASSADGASGTGSCVEGCQ